MANGYQSREINPEPRSGLNSTGDTLAKGTIVTKGAGDTMVVATAATQAFWGVLGEDTPNGSYGRVIVRGVAQVLFSGALTVGARVTSNGSGKAAAASSTNAVLGLAMEVGAADTLAEVELSGPGGQSQ